MQGHRAAGCEVSDFSSLVSTSVTPCFSPQSIQCNLHPITTAPANLLHSSTAQRSKPLTTTRFSDEYPNAKFYKVDVDDVPDVAQELGVRAMPTFVLFKNGDKVGEVVGANPKALEAAIKSNYSAGEAAQE